jgi:hypothetical protein
MIPTTGPEFKSGIGVVMTAGFRSKRAKHTKTLILLAGTHAALRPPVTA